MAARTTMLLEQFMALPECGPDGTHYELSDGELVTSSPSGYRHSAIVINVGTILRTLLDRKKFVVVGGDAGFLLNPRPEAATVRGADVAVNRREDIGTVAPVGLFQGPPLIAIEVVSPSNSAENMERKIRQYLAAGSAEVWVLYPDSERIYIYSAGERAPRIIENGEDFKSVLGHRFNAADFFEI